MFRIYYWNFIIISYQSATAQFLLTIVANQAEENFLLTFSIRPNHSHKHHYYSLSLWLPPPTTTIYPNKHDKHKDKIDTIYDMYVWVASKYFDKNNIWILIILYSHSLSLVSVVVPFYSFSVLLGPVCSASVWIIWKHTIPNEYIYKYIYLHIYLSLYILELTIIFIIIYMYMLLYDTYLCVNK